MLCCLYIDRSIFQEAEERRLEAVKEAIVGATQNALAEKLARRRTLQSRSVPDTDPSTAAVSGGDRTTTPAPPPTTHKELVEHRHVVITPGPHYHVRSSHFVDAEVQTEHPHLQFACVCDNKSRSRRSR